MKKTVVEGKVTFLLAPQALIHELNPHWWIHLKMHVTASIRKYVQVNVPDDTNCIKNAC